jgi:hypothetical protein
MLNVEVESEQRLLYDVFVFWFNWNDFNGSKPIFPAFVVPSSYSSQTCTFLANKCLSLARDLDMGFFCSLTRGVKVGGGVYTLSLLGLQDNVVLVKTL